MLVTAMEDHLAECRRVSRVLHDEVGPTLSAIGFQLDALRYDVPEVAARTAELQALLENAMSRIRHLSLELSNSPVDRAGLRMALEQRLDSMKGQFPGSLTLDWRTEARLPGPVALAFFDVAEHALKNAETHSGASSVHIVVSGEQPVTMEIRDDGRGFDTTKTVEKGLGLLRIAAAAQRIGATFLVESVTGRSTIVKLVYAPSSTPR